MKRKTALIAAIVISSAMAALTFSALVHAGDRYSEDGNPYAYISKREPIYCKQYKASGSLVCTAITDRKFDSTLFQLVARIAGKMIRPNERVEISKGLIDVRAFEYGKLKRIYVATNEKYAEL